MKIRLTENVAGRKKGEVYEVIPNEHAEKNGYYIAYESEGYHGPNGFQVQPHQCEIIESINVKRGNEMRRVIFRDLQTGGYSAHTNIEDMFEMHAEETLLCSERDIEYEEALRRLNGMLEHERREYIEAHGYEIIGNPTMEDIAAWETYHDLDWEETE